MKNYLGLFVYAILVFVSGCDKVLNKNDPVSVSRAFWSAALSDQPGKAAQYMVQGSKLSLGIQGASSNDSAILGKVDQQDGYYFIETTLQLARNNRMIAIPMRTVVVPVNGEWKVDYWSTKQSVLDATLDRSVQLFVSTAENASKYLNDILGAEGQQEHLKHAEARIDEELKHARKMVLQAYQQRLSELDTAKAGSAQPAG